MVAVSSRSSSISSASTASSKYSADAKKKFSCTFPACGKSFSRSEHLHRHALNHKEGNNTCLRCSAHFRRRDLLDRHMARHKEKDDEAGGEGLGVLATRKRLWRDASGTIVNARRPSCTQDGSSKRRNTNRVEKRKAPSTVPERKMTTRGQAILNTLPQLERLASPAMLESRFEYPDPEENNKDQDAWLDMDSQLPSPPTSAPSLQSGGEAELSDLDGLYEQEGWSLQEEVPSPALTSPAEYGYQAAPYQTFMGAMADLPYDDIFKAEHGLYDWQRWDSQVMMSRCREEKFEPMSDERREWNGSRAFLGRP